MTRNSRRSKSAVTLRMVAAHAGVSPMSVSNVLNGRSASAVMNEKVLRAVEKLNYVPNQAARQLASAGPMFIGLVHSNDEHPIATAILTGALTAASRLNVQLLLEPIVYAEIGNMWASVNALRDRGAEGCIVTPIYGESIANRAELDQIDFPLACVGAGSNLEKISTFRIDETAAAYELTTHLIAKGHRRIGFIRVPEEFSIHHTHSQGYTRALADHGLTFDPALVAQGEYTVQEGLAAATALLDLPDPPTAIFASNDEMAAGALTAALSRGLKVPGDLAVAGFDDTYIAQTVWPPLTSVKVPYAAMADQAVERLVRHIRAGTDPRSMPVSSTLLDYTIIPRASTGD
ncbi:LacI family DNA-binding transcriptional regulator [Novosphingobium album (ex Liu et al. 2023)]|uniref:LacI family DNA-binding transcriptional regulator n=1 Tax=Novosphingobium album (ex Liu et al. 2023) TaxID=3031130 RepID=A0ABT5WT02_9SPHN|nr:LacI family DNA-binding transcriptional regulator [Novosphingobium album (ex Liu et al. 2023)]MDE8652979.1 LacI family DNA-binding transcriptional regulator [Novosphingobium album (ex Liu et al. 2023)]